MQTEYYEKWTELCKNLTKPWTELAELNINTFNKIIKNIENVEPINSTKKPEDFISTQTKLFNTTLLEATKYTQEAFRIWLEAGSQASKIVTDLARDTANKTTDTIKTGNKNRERDS